MAYSDRFRSYGNKTGLFDGFNYRQFNSNAVPGLATDGMKVGGRRSPAYRQSGRGGPPALSRLIRKHPGKEREHEDTYH